MLIIFDLDDTLIDTSGCVTPFKLEEALRILLGKDPTPTDLAALRRINERASKTPDALAEFARERGISQGLLARAIEELSAPLPQAFRIACTPQAPDVLRHFAALCPVALVTGGHPPFQREKLEKASIEASIFSKIAIPEDSVKKPYYQAFAEELQVLPEEVWVCGDRISMDLAPAHALGFHTVHMRWGRGKQMPSEPWIEHSISTLAELRNIVR